MKFIEKFSPYDNERLELSANILRGLYKDKYKNTLLTKGIEQICEALAGQDSVTKELIFDSRGVQNSAFYKYIIPMLERNTSLESIIVIYDDDQIINK